MDEIEILQTAKIGSYKYDKKKEKQKSRNEKLLIFTIILFSIFIILLIILLILRYKYSKNIEPFINEPKNVISMNYLNQIYSPKILYNTQFDNNYENTTKNVIHV